MQQYQYTFADIEIDSVDPEISELDRQIRVHKEMLLMLAKQRYNRELDQLQRIIHGDTALFDQRIAQIHITRTSIVCHFTDMQYMYLEIGLGDDSIRICEIFEDLHALLTVRRVSTNPPMFQ